MIWPIFRKDLTLLWPLAVLVTLIQLTLEWATYNSGFYGANPVARELFHRLTLPWYAGLVAISIAVVHEDTIPGADQDWLIRPLARTDLLLAKMLFALATICLPMLVVNFLQELLLGFPILPSFGDALYKEAFLFVCLVVPAMAVAAATRNMTELVLLGVGLVLIYAASLWVSALLFGANRCPTCGSGLEWMQHVLQHLGILAGSVVVLVLQYYYRKTEVSRRVLVVGTVLLVFAQLPWNAAFRIQSRMASAAGTTPASIRIQAGTAATSGSIGGGSGRQESARRATQALLKGNVDAAVENLKHVSHPREPAVVLTVPLQITGLSQDEFVAVDRAEYSLIDARGAVLYHSVRPLDSPAPLLPDPEHGGLVQQTFQIPGAIYRAVHARAVSLSVDFSLTLRTVVAERKLAAINGEFRSPEAGLCQSIAEVSGSFVRCRNIGSAASCVAATLYAPDGRHNPQVLGCTGDYRPFIPGTTNIISFGGLELPIGDAAHAAHYEVESADLAQSYIVMKIYAAGSHFNRTVVASLPSGES
jgi:hypothetical protein